MINELELDFSLLTGWMQTSLATLLLATGALLLLLLLGVSVGQALGMRRWGLPEALLAGAFGLLIAPAGLLPLLPQP